jgi:membrane protein implicated in regulation of membrane protease activity
MDIQIVLLVFGVVFLMLAVTRIVNRKQKGQSSKPDKTAPAGTTENKPRMTEEQFKKSWKSLSYLMLLAAAGNLYMLYNSVVRALETGSYILWIDAVFSLAAAVIAVLIWRRCRKNLVIAYLIITVIPIMIFISTGHSLDGIIRLFPLVLVYFVVKPVWEYID